jgi:hypothetical protein
VRIDGIAQWCIHLAMERFKDCRLALMSSGPYCLIRDLGLVKGGKGLRHHEVALELTWRGPLPYAEIHRPREVDRRCVFRDGYGKYPNS